MKKFKYILINVGLVIIFIILLIFIYRSLKNDNVNQSKIQGIDYVYTCEQYNKKWYAEKKDNPTDEFIELYINCINEKLPFENRLNNLYILFEYTTKNIIFDKYNHQIILNKKNK